MTSKEAKARLPVITAFAEGKAVEFREGSDYPWRESPQLSFDNPNAEYRIKPTPREFWLNPETLRLSSIAPPVEKERFSNWIKLREVLD